MISSKPDVVPNEDTSYLDEQMLNDDGFLRLQPAAAYQRIDPLQLRIWCAKQARYQLVTTEMIEWAKTQVAGRTAIEIGAGMGDFGHHLGIHMTDPGLQKDPQIEAYYKALGQKPTEPPAEVERLDAEAAIKKYRPRVVLACWVTQKWYPGDANGNMYGPEERWIIDNCETYIHFGNHGVHGEKRALKFKHQKLQYPWLVSRAKNPDQNVIYVWE